MFEEEKRKIMIKNFLLDIKKIFKFNFFETYRGFIGMIIILLYKFYKNWKKRIWIKNNSQIPKNFIDQNEIIKVKPISIIRINNFENKNFQEDSDKELNFKHIPLNFPKFIYEQSNNSKEIQFEEFLKIKLAGIQSVDKEGKFFIQKLFDDHSKKFYVKFNNIQYNDNIHIYAWIFFRNRYGIFYSKYYNLNVILARNGFSKICNINTSNVHDENIFYYMSDLIDAENEAKIRGIGIWRDKRSKIVMDYSLNRGNFYSVKKKIAEVFKLKNWQKIILKR